MMAIVYTLSSPKFYFCSFFFTFFFGWIWFWRELAFFAKIHSKVNTVLMSERLKSRNFRDSMAMIGNEWQMMAKKKRSKKDNLRHTCKSRG